MIRSSTGRRTGRAAFTLIEMLVVIFIIGILVTLSTAAAVRFLGASYTSATRTTVQRANSRLQQQLAYVLDQGRQETIPSAAYNLSKDGTGNQNNERARVIHLKFKMQQYFPTTFTEALSPASGYAAVPNYKTFLNQLGFTGSVSSPAPPEESAVCLYMILRFGPNTSAEEDVGLSAAAKTLGSKVNNAQGMVDAWGRPLVLCRWPVGASGSFISPVNMTGPQAFSATGGVSQDPLDPKGWLTGDTTKNSWLATLNAKNFQTICHPLPGRTGGTSSGAPQSINLTPVIVSSGADGQLGLSFDPFDPLFAGNPFTVSNQVQANDNIYSTYVK